MSTTVAVEPLHRIGEVAERVGVTTRTIRYYEELGLLGASSDRCKGAHRLYSDGEVVRLTELVRLRDLLGLSLDELIALADTGEARAALRDQWAGTTNDHERVAIVEEAIPLVQRQLELVHARRQRLDEFATVLAEKLQTLRAEQRKLARKAARAGRD